MSENIRELLAAFKEGEVSEEKVIQQLVRQPFEEHLLGRLDHHREARTGIPEVVLAENKQPGEVADLFRTYLEREDQLVATRVSDSILDQLEEHRSHLHYFEEARILATEGPDVEETRYDVLIVSAGSLDRPVAEEAAVASRLFGNPTDVVHDVGVAGLSRITPDLARLDEAGVVIVVAGMEGALPSLIGGMARQPVVAVPTSAGYGANFEGLSALLTMLNSCVPGTAVMNIDNGFGAAALATKINLLAARTGREEP
jgi:NCAIR mutase (PurE)-related protein